ncbi:MAG: addiction module protein [Protaetiibacter sp.]
MSAPLPDVGGEPQTRGMSMTAQQLLEEAKSLPDAARADLAYQVLLTLPGQLADADRATVDSAWREEIGRRVDGYLAGTATLVDVDESHAEIRAELAALRK